MHKPKRYSLMRLAAVASLVSITLLGNATTIAPVKIADLFAQADQVALVEVRSGDNEHYPITVYKAVVESAYKGTLQGQIVYFGPFLGTEIGSKYLLFLRRGKPVTASVKNDAPYGDVESVSTIMYDGYSSLPVSYQCVFESEDISARCDYAIQLNPEQIVLPKSIRAFPEGDATSITNYKKWVRMKELLALMQTISTEIKTTQH